jgi:hypothetical protein
MQRRPNDEPTAPNWEKLDDEILTLDGVIVETTATLVALRSAGHEIREASNQLDKMISRRDGLIRIRGSIIGCS